MYTGVSVSVLISRIFLEVSRSVACRGEAHIRICNLVILIFAFASSLRRPSASCSVNVDSLGAV